MMGRCSDTGVLQQHPAQDKLVGRGLLVVYNNDVVYMYTMFLLGLSRERGGLFSRLPHPAHCCMLCCVHCFVCLDCLLIVVSHTVTPSTTPHGKAVQQMIPQLKISHPESNATYVCAPHNHTQTFSFQLSLWQLDKHLNS